MHQSGENMRHACDQYVTNVQRACMIKRNNCKEKENITLACPKHIASMLQHRLGVYQARTRQLQQMCNRHVLACTKHVTCAHQACNKHAPSMRKACVRPVPDVHQTCSKHVTVPGICIKRAPGMTSMHQACTMYTSDM
jgi:hypothetical protein